MKNILFELIMTNQCNKRCKYCDLRFKNKSISYFMLDDFISFLKKEESDNISFLINFFWWEALLEYQKIIYFIEKTKKIKNIRYSIWTNWILLDKDKYNYLSKNNVEIYLSIDTESIELSYLKNYLRNYNKLIINFILNPNTINKSFVLFKKIFNYWYKNYNIIPVFLTKRWQLESLNKLNNIKKYILSFTWWKYIFYSYFQKPTSDIQFIVDTNWFIYKDLHTHLWIIKQFSGLDKSIMNDIENFTFVGNISSSLTLQRLLENYDQYQLVKKTWELPKKIWIYKDFKLLDIILNWN